VTISLVGTPTVAEAAATTGITNNVPAGVADNDFLVWLTGQTTSTSSPPLGRVDTTPVRCRRRVLAAGLVSLCLQRTGVLHHGRTYRIPCVRRHGRVLRSRRHNAVGRHRGGDGRRHHRFRRPCGHPGHCRSLDPRDRGLPGRLRCHQHCALVVEHHDRRADTSTSGASTNMAGAISHQLWSGSGALTPAWSASNATTRTIAGAYALRPAAGGAAVAPFKARPVINRAALLRASGF
jgi:hypothetical protein